VLPENVLTDEVAQYSPITLNKARLLILSIPFKRKRKVLQRSQLKHMYFHKCFLKMRFSKSRDEYLEEGGPFIHVFLWFSVVSLLKSLLML
jgi:hypothetical protein